MELDSRIGNFLPGKELDALLVDPYAEGCSSIDEFDGVDLLSHSHIESTIMRNLEKWLNLGDDRNIRQVYVRGKPVLPFPS